MLLYGTWGVGKTILACKIGQNPMHLVTEPSDDSLADWPELRKSIDVVEYGGVAHLKLIAQAFEEKLYTNDTLIVDTASELVEEHLDIFRAQYKPAKATRPTFQNRTAGQPAIELVGTDDYRLLRDSLRPTIKTLCMLPINVIFIAHEREPTWTDESKLKEDGTALPPMRPDLPSQTLKMIAKRVSLIGRMTRSGDRRQISFRTDSVKEEVKSRIRALDNRRMSDEEFLSVVNAWRA